jgi:hypothetical protein
MPEFRGNDNKFFPEDLFCCFFWISAAHSKFMETIRYEEGSAVHDFIKSNEKLREVWECDINKSLMENGGCPIEIPEDYTFSVEFRGKPVKVTVDFRFGLTHFDPPVTPKGADANECNQFFVGIILPKLKAALESVDENGEIIGFFALKAYMMEMAKRSIMMIDMLDHIKEGCQQAEQRRNEIDRN